jgi:hypothetical protein
MKLAISRWAYCENNAEKLPKTIEELDWCMRDLREVLLKECDWTVGIDSPLEQSVKDAWITWRQWMRDITQHVTINDVVEYVEILNPPTIGRPNSWSNFEVVDTE